MKASATVTAELLQWHSVDTGMPDAELTVLMWMPDFEDGGEWEGGWWDGEHWRLCESGGVCPWRVTHWAAPEGPAC